MNLQVKRLILHEYSDEDVRKNCVPNALKSDTLELNRETNRLHPFANDILCSDIVFDIEDINHPQEQYGYFFFSKMVSPDGVIGYVFDKIVLDESLQEDFIRFVTKNVLLLLIDENNSVTNRIITRKGSYPLSERTLNETSNAVSDEIISWFITERDGFMNNPDTLKWFDDLERRMNGK